MNEFDSWNEIKKIVDKNNEKPDRFPQEGEVWMSALGKNIGFEQNGAGDDFARPVLIVKKFNNRMFWCVPLSTKQKDLDFYVSNEKPRAFSPGMTLSPVSACPILKAWSTNG